LILTTTFDPKMRRHVRRHPVPVGFYLEKNSFFIVLYLKRLDAIGFATRWEYAVGFDTPWESAILRCLVELHLRV